MQDAFGPEIMKFFNRLYDMKYSHVLEVIMFMNTNKSSTVEFWSF